MEKVIIVWPKGKPYITDIKSFIEKEGCVIIDHVHTETPKGTNEKAWNKVYGKCQILIVQPEEDCINIRNLIGMLANECGAVYISESARENEEIFQAFFESKKEAVKAQIKPKKIKK